LQIDLQIHLQIDFHDDSVVVMSTISKVAERAGVSRTTVSHVINHADRVSKPLRDKVLAAIEELGYQPNPQARSLRTGRTNLVAVMIPDILNPYYVQIVRVIQQELATVGLEILILNTDVPGGHSVEHGRQFLRQVNRKRLDGIIIADFAVHWMQEAIATLEIPAVLIGTLPGSVIDSVGLDDAGGARMMGHYLAGKGYRRIGHVTGPSFFEQAVVRRQAFGEGFADAGGDPPLTLHFEGSYLPPSGYEGVSWLLDRPQEERPEAIFFSSSLMAQGGLAALFDRGVALPSEMGVATFGGWEHFEFVRPRVTRVGNDPSLLARRGIEMLLERMGGTFEGEPRREVIDCILKVFDTA
jgi:DNA-binding LacI/PurR family transcriptional regulator